jgi:hypothetical protein
MRSWMRWRPLLGVVYLVVRQTNDATPLHLLHYDYHLGALVDYLRVRHNCKYFLQEILLILVEGDAPPATGYMENDWST